MLLTYDLVLRVLLNPDLVDQLVTDLCQFLVLLRLSQTEHSVTLIDSQHTMTVVYWQTEMTGCYSG